MKQRPGFSGPGKRKRRRRRYGAADVAEKTGISRQLLQQYVSMGLVDVAERDGDGLALFDESVLVRVKLIRDLNDTGYTLRDIRDIFFR